MALFQKGISGNPGGRPKAIKDISRAARAHTFEALETLVRVMSDDTQPGRDRIKAAEIVLNRGWGLPVPATPEFTAEQMQSMSDDQLERLARSKL